MFKRLWRYLFSKKRRVPTPTPIVVDVPVEVVVTVPENSEKDTEDNGYWKAPDWSFLWDNSTVDAHRLDDIKGECEIIMKNKKRYEPVADKIGCPWWFIAALHYRESSLSFKGALHNGDRILGTGRKTYRVPKNRGPFKTWEESAIDALELKKYHLQDDWSVYDCLRKAERFNGLGYRHKGSGEYSPYVWAGTNMHDETGKYVSDGRYKNSAVERQLGVASLWKGLQVFSDVEL